MLLDDRGGRVVLADTVVPHDRRRRCLRYRTGRRVSLMLLGPVSQPIRVVAGAVTRRPPGVATNAAGGGGLADGGGRSGRIRGAPPGQQAHHQRAGSVGAQVRRHTAGWLPARQHPVRRLQHARRDALTTAPSDGLGLGGIGRSHGRCGSGARPTIFDTTVSLPVGTTGSTVWLRDDRLSTDARLRCRWRCTDVSRGSAASSGGVCGRPFFFAKPVDRALLVHRGCGCFEPRFRGLGSTAALSVGVSDAGRYVRRLRGAAFW